MLVPKSDRVCTMRSSCCLGVHNLANCRDDQTSLCVVGSSEKERLFDCVGSLRKCVGLKQYGVDRRNFAA